MQSISYENELICMKMTLYTLSYDHKKTRFEKEAKGKQSYLGRHVANLVQSEVIII